MSAVLPRPTPLDRTVSGIPTGPGEFTGSYTVRADETVLRGHYPGLPIFPGVCLLECVDQAVRQSVAGLGEPVLAEVESCRFLAPVFPGRTVTVRTTAEPTADGLRCRAELSCGDERVATARLRYRLAVAA
ncbi:3-hydroxyacyl-ACP dehydratase FabZ family protein [Kitasatospora sp. P5_F3]